MVPRQKIEFRSVLCALLFLSMTLNPLGATVPVGVSKVDVTPTHPVLLAGYGGRTTEHEGVDTPLWARAMVIGQTKPAVIVVLDNCGVTQAIKDRLAKRLAKSGVAADRLVVATTHTHNAPTLVGYAPIVWKGRTTPEQDKRVEAYTQFAIDQMERAVAEALARREPMTLEWTQGRATFGGNRRVINGGNWAGFGHQRNAPVDHSLPVLAARDADGAVRAVWANYACHCTTVGGRNRISGDWAGFANTWIEKEFGDAVSLMTIGCGADVGPQPSGNLAIAEDHGRAIATETKRLLSEKTAPLKGAPIVTARQIRLPLAKPKPREHWEEQLNSGGFHHQLAKAMLAKLDATGEIPAEVNYPVSVWKFSNDLAMVFLAGEVVVDYSVRLKRELDWSRLWLIAWANDMPGYIPSRRILREGGYEADFSQVYYEQPGRYDPAVEDQLVNTIREMVGTEFEAKPGQTPSPYHKPPSGESLAVKRLASWAGGDRSEAERMLIQKLQRYARIAQPAVARLTSTDQEETEWHNFAGDFVQRTFIRQQKVGTQLAWVSPPFSKLAGTALVYSFSGGTGWITEPKTDGFALDIGGEEKLRFDVTKEATRWVSKDGAVELIYLPTWTSNVDTGGFFFVALTEIPVNDDGAVEFAVRSLGQGSKRWFALDTKQPAPALLQKLTQALAGNAKKN
jgi:neutral ceramidase